MALLPAPTSAGWPFPSQEHCAILTSQRLGRYEPIRLGMLRHGCVDYFVLSSSVSDKHYSRLPCGKASNFVASTCL